MKILRAESLGMCFGVRDAIALALEQADAGPLTILGSFLDGTRGDITVLAIKSTLDGFSSIVFAATLGWGVLLSAVSVLVVPAVVPVVV